VSVGAHPGTDPWEALDDLFDQLEVCGYNYKGDKYRPDHERRPKRVILGTESFPTACFDHWMAVEDMSWVAGDFVWTAMDYLGESALGCTHFEGEQPGYQTWPWTVANCGDLDLCGWKRPQSYYRDVVWRTGAKVSAFVQRPLPEGKTAEHVYGWGWPDVRASWTWPGMEGKALTVHVYSACERVRLEVNGKDLGTKDTNRSTRFEATWDVPYEAGTLVAIGLDDSGKEVARWELKTAEAPATIRMTADRATIVADGQDLSFVTVELLDRHGVMNPNADDVVSFEVEGPARIVGVGNGDPRSVESFQQPRRKAYRGRCMVVVKAGEKAGTVRLKAQAEGMKGAEAVIKAEKGKRK
jgi:beta-galactosidase